MPEVCASSCSCFCHSIAFNGLDATPEQIATRCIACGDRATDHRPPNLVAWAQWILWRTGQIRVRSPLPRPGYLKAHRYGPVLWEASRA